jgi:hypothetical protein
MAISSTYIDDTPPDETNPGSQGAITGLTEVEVNRIAADYADMIDACLSARADQENQWEKYLKSYRSRSEIAQKNYPWEGASNLTIGLSSIYVDTVVAKIVGQVNALDPPWVVQQLSAQWASGKLPRLGQPVRLAAISRRQIHDLRTLKAGHRHHL